MLGSVIAEVILVCLFILAGHFDDFAWRTTASVSMLFLYSIPCLFYSKIYDYKFKNPELLAQSIAEKMFWDDPLLGEIYTYFTNAETPTVMDDLAALLDSALKEIPDAECSLDPALACVREEICMILMKINARKELLKAYGQNDRSSLKRLADSVYPAMIEQMKKTDALMRDDWHATACSTGLEVIQGRNWGCISRLYETSKRLHEFLEGKIDRIEELDEALKFLKSGDIVPPFVYTASHP